MALRTAKGLSMECGLVLVRQSNTKARAAEVSKAESVVQRVLVDDRSASHIDQNRASRQPTELPRAEQLVSRSSAWERNDERKCARQQLVEATHAMDGGDAVKGGA